MVKSVKTLNEMTQEDCEYELNKTIISHYK